MSFESPNQLSATTIGGGSSTPRRRNATTRPSSMPCTQHNLSRHGAPGPVGSGRLMAKSTGTTSLPSPMTTTRRMPSIPESTRCSWPLHQVPTRPNCSPYFLKTESSPTQVHCQRLRVASLLLAAERHNGTSTSRPKRRSRLIQERLGIAPSRRTGRFLSQPRTRHSSVLVRQPKRGGHIIPTTFPNSLCWLRKRPSISATKLSGRPKSWSACFTTLPACCAWRRSWARRSCAVWRRRCLALACFFAYRFVGDMWPSWLLSCVWSGGSLSKHPCHRPPCVCENSVTSASRAHRTSCCFLLSLCGIYVPERLFPFPRYLLHAASVEGGWTMSFEEILNQTRAMLQRQGRVSYRALKRQFDLDDAYVEDVKLELIEVHRVAVDQDNTMLVWTGGAAAPPATAAAADWG